MNYTGEPFEREDERPFAWGVCSVCGCDCAEEDYNPITRVSMHQSCEAEAEAAPVTEVA